jgi:hypothetical protein
MDTCRDCGGLVSAKEDRIECYGCGKDYGLSKNYQGLPPTPQPTPQSTPQSNELQEIRIALERVVALVAKQLRQCDESNEHLKSIRVYIGWFWWILIGIPIILIIIGVIIASSS